jgi:glyoxylase-like metal-dependent hydrolase (beta-lactamase superfamily II)
MKRLLLLTGIFMMLFTACNPGNGGEKYPDWVPASVEDSIEKGPYTVRKLAEGIYHVEDRLTDISGWTVDASGDYNSSDMYVILGNDKAFMVDLSNKINMNNAAVALREIVYGLIGSRKLEIGVSHGHPDHVGMAFVFVGDNVPIYFGTGEYNESMWDTYALAPDRVTVFEPGEKTFDLGGRKLSTIKVPGHTNSSTVYNLDGENLMFSGDAIGSGAGCWFFSLELLNLFEGGLANLKAFVEDEENHIDKNTLKIYGGHSWQYNRYKDLTGVTYTGHLNWQYAEDLVTCLAKMKEGAWKDTNSGLRFVEWGYHLMVFTGDFIYGTGAITAPMEVAESYAAQ